MKTLTRAFVRMPILFLSLSNSFAQTQTITGTITNGDKQRTRPGRLCFDKGRNQGNVY